MKYIDTRWTVRIPRTAQLVLFAVLGALMFISKIVMAGLPNIEILPMEIGLGGRTYTSGPGGDISVEEFYGALESKTGSAVWFDVYSQGHTISTSKYKL